jgi:hypothetical protein
MTLRNGLCFFNLMNYLGKLVSYTFGSVESTCNYASSRKLPA